MFIHLHKKGQGTLEYAVIIAVIVAALLTMQIYIKRGLQGRFRQASDDIGDQFSPGITTGGYTTVINAQSNEQVTGGNRSLTRTNSLQSQNRTGNESVGVQNQEWMP